MAEATDRELAWVLRHEACHLRGHDSRLGLLFGAASAGFWWNPALRWLGTIWAEAREHCCDAAAAGGGEDATAYGHYLLDWSAQPALRGGIAMARGGAHRMRRRLTALKRQPLPVPTFRFKAAAVMAVAVLGLTVSCSRVMLGEKDEPEPVGSGRSEPAVGVTAGPVEDGHNDATPGVLGGFSAGVIAGLGEDERHQGSKEQEDWDLTGVQELMKTTLQVVASQQRLEESGKVLEEQAVKGLFRRLAMRRENLLLTWPSVVSKEGREVKIELCRLRIDREGNMQWVGWFSTVNYQTVDDDTMATFSIEHVFDRDHYEFSPSAREVLNLVRNNGSFRGAIQSGQSVVVPLSKKEEAGFIYAIVKFDMTDATGHPFEAGSIRRAKIK